MRLDPRAEVRDERRRAIAPMRTMALSRPVTPWEQPPPATIAYIVFPMKATSAAPLTSDPRLGLVWLLGSCVVTVVRTPWESMREMRPPVRLPVYGPTSGATCSHWPTVELVPPTPPSATYNLPSGPNFSPRGLLSPVGEHGRRKGLRRLHADEACRVGEWIGRAARARDATDCDKRQRKCAVAQYERNIHGGTPSAGDGRHWKETQQVLPTGVPRAGDASLSPGVTVRASTVEPGRMQPWVSALFGGVLIGLSATALLWLNGRVAGISGIVHALTKRAPWQEWAWRLAFVAGLMLAGGIAMHVAGSTRYRPARGVALPAGGVARRLRHGARRRLHQRARRLRIGRLSKRSLAAVVVFMATCDRDGLRRAARLRRTGMSRILAAFFAGALFGIGLVVGRMSDPNVVTNFLDLFGNFDPSLLFVMLGAMGTTLVLFRFVLRRDRPLLDADFHLPTRRSLDAPLLIGAAIFGIGWGLSGYCPRPRPGRRGRRRRERAVVRARDAPGWHRATRAGAPHGALNRPAGGGRLGVGVA
jgi:uncharacterized membrane protein YedE/YeeE